MERNALDLHPIAGFGSEMNQRFAPHCSDYPRWMSRIKQALDPLGILNPGKVLRSPTAAQMT